MRFSKYNQPRRHCGGRKPDPNSNAGQKRAAIYAAEQKRQAESLAAFESSTSGTFDGFQMVDAFHRAHDKRDALEVLTADDCADAVTSTGATIHAGADGVTVYIMTAAARDGVSDKRVIFNRSIYIF